MLLLNKIQSVYIIKSLPPRPMASLSICWPDRPVLLRFCFLKLKEYTQATKFSACVNCEQKVQFEVTIYTHHY